MAGRRASSGQSFVEYLILAVAIVVVCIASTQLLGNQLHDVWNNIAAGLP